MAYRGRSRILVDTGNGHEQQQSPLFTVVPLDVRRHIYLQLWLDYGTVQHIHLFGPSSYLCHYPCLLDKNASTHHDSPSPPSLELEASTEVAAEAGAQTIDDGTEFDSHDDPGDIDGAIQDMASASQQQLVPAAPSGSDDDEHDHVESSSCCMHEKCFVAYLEAYGMSFEQAYSSNYRRPRRAASGNVGITKPFLVCKKMYTEASESLYSATSFSFSDVSVFERFMETVPRALTDRIPFVDIMATIPTDGVGLPQETKRLLSQHPDTSLPPLETFCTKLKSVLSNVQGLRLCIHLTGSSYQRAPRPLPGKDWFEPLYRLSDELSQQNLRDLEVNLVTRCDFYSFGGPGGLLVYGFDPKFLADAPFRTILVPPGWHADSTCCAYWVDPNSGTT